MGCACSSEREGSDSFFSEVCTDYRELEEYTGDGLKRTRAWEGTITKAELKAKRELFWLTRRTGYSIVWLQIRQAVEADASSAEFILENAGVLPVGNNLEVCRDYDGHVYKVPIFVLNDPVKFTRDQTFSDKQVKLVLRSSKGDIVCSPQLDATVAELKRLASLPEATLFFNGRRMPDFTQLYEFNLEDEMVVICHRASAH